jgi:hypothetical protein
MLESLIHTTPDLTAAIFSAPSSISAFPSREQANTSTIVSSASESGNHSNNNAQSPVPAVKPRPKPRPKFKKAQPEKGPSTANGIPQPSIDDVPPPQNSHFEDVSTSPLPLTIADRAKSRSRKSRKPPLATSSHATSDIINIPTDSEDELQLLPSSRSKSKSKSKQTGPNPPEPAKIIEIPDSQQSLPAPTSDIQQLPPSASSQLPPSDPPTTIPPSTPESIRVQRANKDNISPPSSPWQPVRKRKRHSLIEDDVGPSLRRIPSPEPFFAPSSLSFAMPAPEENLDNINDDTTENNAPRKKVRKAAKPAAKTRKRKGAQDNQQFTTELCKDPDGDAQLPASRRHASGVPDSPAIVTIPKKRKAREKNLDGEEQGIKTTKKRSSKKGTEDQDKYEDDAGEEDGFDKPKAKKQSADKNARGKGKGRRVISEDEDEDHSYAKRTADIDIRPDKSPAWVGKSDALNEDQSEGPVPSVRNDAVKVSCNLLSRILLLISPSRRTLVHLRMRRRRRNLD